MKRSRAYAYEEGRAGTTTRLRPVSRVWPRRPRWGQLYVALVTVGTAGAATHFMAPHPTLVRIADVGCGLGMFGVLAIWMRLNRIALTRLDEPEAGVDRPHVRIVRSRKPAPSWNNRRIGRLDPEERIVLPYVFR